MMPQPSVPESLREEYCSLGEKDGFNLRSRITVNLTLVNLTQISILTTS